jgi:hypothetical protein
MKPVLVDIRPNGVSVDAPCLPKIPVCCSMRAIRRRALTVE